MRIAILICLLCVPLFADTQTQWTEIHGNGVYSTADSNAASLRAEGLATEFHRGNLGAVAQRTDDAIGGILRVAVMNLKRHRHYQEANWIQREWKRHQGKLIVLAANQDRNIGDFAPLSTFLADAYDKIESKLGHQLCYTLRISDLKTINFTVPVVFSPCKYGLTEFQLHFIHDQFYRGLAPVVAYWVTVITCSMATYGAGYFFICSPIGMLVELVIDRKVAPWLSVKIYSAVCD